MELNSTLFNSLAAMPEILRQASRRVSPDKWSRRPSENAFSLIEHSWHLADLEREGFGVRITRLLSEIDPELPNFDGARLARERNYSSLRFEDGLAAFAAARTENLSRLRHVSASEAGRAGRQEGVGIVRLADIPRLMSEHDASHREEIAALMAELASGGEGGVR